MATRLKTIRFATETYNSTITTATVTNLTQFTVYIPETVISFESVTVDVNFQDIITATGGTITEHRVGLQLGANGYNTSTYLADIANSGENIGGVIGPISKRTYFTTYWTGTSMTCDIQVYFDQSTGTTLGMVNCNAVLTITYTYDDDESTNSTQIKTVYIPLESTTTALTTTSNTNIGTNQIPALTSGGLFPESVTNIRDYYFLIEGNDCQTTVTPYTISCNIDSGTAYSFASASGILASSIYQRYIYKPSSIPDTTTAHNFQLWSDTVSKFNHCVITLVVTYEFTVSTTTSILNSLLLPLEIASPLGLSSSSFNSRFVRDIYLPEESISMKQSSFRINFNSAAPVAGLNFRMGSQTFRAYTQGGSANCGMFSLQQRIDSGSVLGAGLTLTKGKNSIVIDGYATDTTDQATNINGYLILNYTCDKPTEGVGAASHTIQDILIDWDSTLYDYYALTFSLAIPETNYYLIGVGFVIYLWQSSSSTAITFDTACLSTEGKGGGYYDIYTDAYQSDAERSCTIIYMSGKDVFKRHPYDATPDTIDIETSRTYRYFSSSTAANGILGIFTYHSISFSTTLTIAGSSGGGVGVKLFRESDNQLIGEYSRTGDGDITLIGFDNSTTVYAVAYESSTRLGRSINFKFGD